MQLREMREYAARRGWEISGEYTDHGISGSRESRPALNRLMADAQQRSFDAVLVWKIDRFERSLKHLVNSLAELAAWGVAFVIRSTQREFSSMQIPPRREDLYRACLPLQTSCQATNSAGLNWYRAKLPSWRPRRSASAISRKRARSSGAIFSSIHCARKAGAALRSWRARTISATTCRSAARCLNRKGSGSPSDCRAAAYCSADRP